ncbi:hypothetical protein [Ancylobacter rudongensis]|uniref:Uncharacterized protein n=1 Tax=Ancylobacter rudongensis TaxID=177413 RepID=A0A1G4UQ36_9HYPH|nr:hypothetical protein [Ancylobacter rudongensis]SCW95732.1 hypothetical protein SAMN05660859_0104 [Ancylobacter rudongensis]
MRRFKTLASDNQFSFICPIFNVATRMAACMKLRDLVWKGKGPDVRKGCQACMKSSKCPAAAIVDRIHYGGKDVADDYGSDQPVMGKLGADVLDRIRRVIVQDVHIQQCGVPPEEQQLILSANPRIDEQLKTAPTDGKAKRYVASDYEETPRRRAPKPKSAPQDIASPAPSSRVNDAARTGDLAAAIS